MKKNTIKKKISEVSAVLTSKRAQLAISNLLEELESYKEPKLEVASNQDSHFSLPAEVKAKTNAFALYTDGACRGNPGPGSYAYMIQSFNGTVLNEAADIDKMTTNNKMELTAIIKGLDSLAAEVSPMNEIFVYTDSKYVVDGMKSWIHNWKKRGWKKADNKPPENIDLWKELDELSRICHVSFNWIKGHAGHPQNEHVDNLANIALDENGF